MAVIKKFYEGDNNVSLDTTKGRSKFSIKVNGEEAVQLHVVDRQLADGIPVHRPGCYFNYYKRPHKPSSNKIWHSILDMAKEFFRDNDLEFRGSLTYEGPVAQDGKHHTLSRCYHLPDAAHGHYVVVRDTNNLVHLLTVSEKDELYNAGFLKSAIVRSDVPFVPNDEVNLNYESEIEGEHRYGTDSASYYSLYLNRLDSGRNLTIEGKSVNDLCFGINLYINDNVEEDKDNNTLHIPSLNLSNDNAVRLKNLIKVNLKIIGNYVVDNTNVHLKLSPDDIHVVNFDFEGSKSSFIKFVRKLFDLPSHNMISGTSLRKIITERFTDIDCYRTYDFDRKNFNLSKVREIVEDFDNDISLDDFIEKHSVVRGHFKTSEEIQKEIMVERERQIARRKAYENRHKAKSICKTREKDFERKYENWVKKEHEEEYKDIYKREPSGRYIVERKTRKRFRKRMIREFVETTGLKRPVYEEVLASL